MAGMKPAPMTRAAWLRRLNDSRCGRLLLALDADFAPAPVALAGRTAVARGVRRASQWPAPEGDGLPACGRKISSANDRRQVGDLRRRGCDDRAGRQFWAAGDGAG